MINGIVLVGGFPKPIGGVTTFVRRLAAADKRVEEVVDMYRGGEKAIPADYAGRYRRLNSLWLGFAYLSVKMLAWRGKAVHFNFSNLTSLMFVGFMPKNGTEWILTLHHGVLESRVPDFLVGPLLRRFDHIVCINQSQYETYRGHGVDTGRLVKATPYIKPGPVSPEGGFRQDVDEYFAARPTFVASGYPTSLYNLDWCIRFVREREEYQLVLFVYGEGAEKARIQEQLAGSERVKAYWDQSEDNFNYALSRCFRYLRPNVRDSFGIAVTDAVNYGVPVLASDVCPRPKGAGTFKITDYASFENALVDALRHKRAAVESESTPFVPFSYDLFKRHSVT